MLTFNRTLQETVLKADGAYLDAPGLERFEQFVQTYSSRLETYQNLRDQSASLMLKALQKFAQSHPEMVQQHGQRCRYDMSEVLRYIALSILRDDELFFREQMLIWLDSILLAHRKQNQCMVAYRYLQEVINADLPATNSQLIHPYLEAVILALQSHA